MLTDRTRLPGCGDGGFDGATGEDAVDEDDHSFAVALIELLEADELVEQAHITDLELLAARLAPEEQLISGNLEDRRELQMGSELRISVVC